MGKHKHSLIGPFRVLPDWPTARIPGHMIVATDFLETAVALVPAWGCPAQQAEQLAIANLMGASWDLQDALEGLLAAEDAQAHASLNGTASMQLVAARKLREAIDAARAAVAKAKPPIVQERAWTGPGELERTGYIPKGSATEREGGSDAR